MHQVWAPYSSPLLPTPHEAAVPRSGGSTPAGSRSALSPTRGSPSYGGAADGGFGGGRLGSEREK